MSQWIVFDYGCVLTLPQPAADLAAMTARSGLDEDIFWDRYWKQRVAYDRGDLDPAAYWSAVLGAGMAENLPAELDALDVHSWHHLNDATFDVVRTLASRRSNLALLSNTPEPLAATMESAAWAGHFAHHFYSCRLRLTKPDPAIFRHVLTELGAAATDVTFVDDRPENIDSARKLGIRGVLFTDAKTLAADLDTGS
jgi:putative hydrolase of the HAD superfamily